MNDPKMPRRYNEFAKDHTPLDGEKMKINDILNREILVIGYRVKKSKYGNGNGDGRCLTIQYELDGRRYVTFTGSAVLAEQCSVYASEMPFVAVMRKIDRYYTFT